MDRSGPVGPWGPQPPLVAQERSGPPWTTLRHFPDASGKATHQNTIKSGIPEKTSTMQNTQSNDSTGATQESPEWIHLTLNRSSSAPPPVVKQERHSHTPESDVQHDARNATRTSPEYSGSPKKEVAHASMNWTDCTDDGCQIHLGEKQGSGWYPQVTRRARKASVAHDHDWRQEMEANPGEDWPPAQPRRRMARSAPHEITSWEHCFNDNCHDHRWEKGDAGYYPRQVGEKGTLSKHDSREHRKRSAVRIRLGREGSEKTILDVRALEGQISDLQSQLDRAAQISVSKDNDLERLDKEKEKGPTSLYTMQTEDAPNRENALETRSLASWDRCKRGKGPNVTNGDPARQTLT